MNPLTDLQDSIQAEVRAALGEAAERFTTEHRVRIERAARMMLDRTAKLATVNPASAEAEELKAEITIAANTINAIALLYRIDGHATAKRIASAFFDRAVDLLIGMAFRGLDSMTPR